MKKEVKNFYIEEKGGLSSMAMFRSPFTWNAISLLCKLLLMQMTLLDVCHS
jgi:hypothetical protein